MPLMTTENPVEKLTTEEFANKILAKYPEYSDIPHAELAQKIVAKYPEYADMVDLNSPAAPTVTASTGDTALVNALAPVPEVKQAATDISQGIPEQQPAQAAQTVQAAASEIPIVPVQAVPGQPTLSPPESTGANKYQQQVQTGNAPTGQEPINPVAVDVLQERTAVLDDPKVCDTTFWSIFQFIPALSLPIRPFLYCSPIASCGTKRPFSESTIVADVKGSTIHERRPSRGAPSASK